MARSMLKLTDPERIAINNRLGKTIRWLGEHSLTKATLVELYGDDNPILALLDDDPNKEISLIEAISLGIFSQAMKGDIRAAEFIRDTMGEKPATNVNVTTQNSTTLSALTTEQLLALVKDKTGQAILVDTTVVEDKDKTHSIEADKSPFDEGTGDTSEHR